MLAQTTPAYDKPDDESPRPNHPEGSGGAGGVASIAQAIDLIKRELEIKPEPEIKLEPEIKQEPFTIRGYFGFDDGE